MRVTVIGASGLLGKYILREWKDDPLAGLSSKDVDIRDAQQVCRVVAAHPAEWIVLAAAYTDVDGCETNTDLAFEINTRGAVNVARAARESGSRLLFLSTDYVFDGMKRSPYETNDRRNPQTVYGRSKAEAEVRILELLPKACIVRTSWLFGVGGRCFPETILKLAATRRELEVVDDQRGCPTYARDLARVLRELCHRNAEGIVHATNAGDCTWFELASEVVKLWGSPTTVRATTSDRFRRPAERPKYSVLSASSLAGYEIEMPHWRDTLGNYLTERRAQLTGGRG